MVRGRPRLPGTDEERLLSRRFQVKSNVQAFRSRRKEQRCQDLALHFYNLHSRMTEPVDVGSTNLPTCQTPGRVANLKWNASKLVPTNLRLSRVDRERTNRLLSERISSALKLQMPIIINPSRINGRVCLDLMLDKYLPGISISIDRHSKVDSQRGTCSESTCKTWILSATAAFDDRGGEVLRDALLSMACCIIGREHGDDYIQMQGRYAYGRALFRVRKAIDIASTNGIDLAQTWLPLSCLVCAISELLTNRSIASHFKHLDGVAQLIDRGGPASLISGDVLALFFEHRTFYVAKCFYQRQSCFYSRKEWIDHPGKTGDQNQLSTCPFNTLMEIAYSIPELMEVFDAQPDTKSTETLQKILQSVRKLDRRLLMWKQHAFKSVCGPIFNISRGEGGLFSDSVSFLNFPTAFALLYYFACRVYLADMMFDIVDCMSLNTHNGRAIDTDTIAHEATETALDMASIICQSIEYCFDPQNKIGGKLIAVFPFDAAWHAFTRAKWQGFDVNAQLAWCESTAERFESHGIPLLRTKAQLNTTYWVHMEFNKVLP